MKIVERNVMRLVAVQHLRAAYGIKTKNWNKNKAASSKSTSNITTKVFGVSLDSLPCYNMENGRVPSFLVDACMMLMAHVDTEGLFRKSGSVVRLKALRAKIDGGEECLSTALPCDVAGLVKQFFRELPEPVLPTELHEVFLKARQLPVEEDRTSATMLLSCVLPEKNLSVLHYFFDFLHNVSKRCEENKMDSSNLSVILAPNLLHSGDGTEKMNANTEKRLKLQASVVQCFIENAPNFGVLPQCLQAKVPAMMGCESGLLSPTHNELEELDLNSGVKRRNRRSFGDVVSGALCKIKTNRTPTHATNSDGLVFSSATPVIGTPSSKRKLPLESGHSFGFSNKKRRSVKKNLGIDLLPSALFSGASTPGSVHSASGVLDSSQNAPPSAGRSRRQSATTVRRKSRRLSSRHAVNRVESGRAGCFSPKVGKKDVPRKSLRLRFSLGKSSRDAGSESIGWRLATQESKTSFCFTKDTEFSPSVVARKTESKNPKFISKSEDNLLTPQCDSSTHQISWTGETPVGAKIFSGASFTDTPMSMCLKNTYKSEPAIILPKSPALIGLPKKLCCASSAESLESENSVSEALTRTRSTPPKTSGASAETESDGQVPCWQAAENMPKTSDALTVISSGTPVAFRPVNPVVFSQDNKSLLASDQNLTFGQFDIAALSPLHIDSVVFEPGAYCSPMLKASYSSQRATAVDSPHSYETGDGEIEAEPRNCSRLIDALDVQSPAHFRPGVSSGLQSTPYKVDFQFSDVLGTPPKLTVLNRSVHDEDEFPAQGGTKAAALLFCDPQRQQANNRRVADHIQHFNKLTLHSPKGSKAAHIRSPLRFQRTPVRQTVCRINSLLGDSRRPSKASAAAAGPTAMESGLVVKALSLESGLSPHPHRQPHQQEPLNAKARSMLTIKKPPPVPPKRTSTLSRPTKSCALGDVTNKVQPKTKVDTCETESAGCQTPNLKQVVEEDKSHYRGSPRNPLNQVRLLSATRPVDL